MEQVLQAAVEGLLLVFSWPNILYPVAGTLLAMFFAAMPGLSGITLMAIAIPFTFAWSPLEVMLLFGALVGGATFMGSVTAILLNIPGTGPNAATLLDGHPMARRGEARTAIACSALASALGSTFGVAALILLIPVMRRAILAFGPPEFMMLAIWGLMTIAAVSRGSFLKGLVMSGLGLLFSFAGLDPRTAEMRYTFGSLYLRDGISLVPFFLGIFAVAEMIDLTVRRLTTISGRTRVEELAGSVSEGLGAVFRHFGLFLRSSVIGTLVGLVPGMGGTVAGFVAYGQAVQSSRKGREDFGSGDIRGVLAPEAANDAKDGASLVPTLAFGVPGSEGTALLLTALTLHGLVPGKELMTSQLHLVFVLIWSLFFANWMTSILGVAMVDRLAWITVVPVRWLAPLVFVLSATGAWIYKGRLGDVAALFLFGLLGYYMKKHRWPRICLVIALVLGNLFEVNLQLTLQLLRLERITLWSRPVALVILALALLSLTIPLLRSRAEAGRKVGGRGGGADGEVAFAAFLLALAALFLLLTLRFGGPARLVPLAVAVPTAFLALAAFLREARGPAGEEGKLRRPLRALSRAEAEGLSWLMLLPAMLWLLGYAAGGPLYLFICLKWRAREGTAFSLTVAAVMWAFIYLLLHRAMELRLYGGLLPGLLPW